MRNVARPPSPCHPPTTTPIHLSSAHPHELWGIHSFKCWFQGPALRIDACSLSYFQNQRMRRGDLFWGRTCRLRQFPHSAPYVLLLETGIFENHNKQNNGVHGDMCRLKHAGYEMRLCSNAPHYFPSTISSILGFPFLFWQEVNLLVH